MFSFTVTRRHGSNLGGVRGEGRATSFTTTDASIVSISTVIAIAIIEDPVLDPKIKGGTLLRGGVQATTSYFGREVNVQLPGDSVVAAKMSVYPVGAPAGVRGKNCSLVCAQRSFGEAVIAPVNTVLATAVDTVTTDFKLITAGTDSGRHCNSYTPACGFILANIDSSKGDSNLEVLGCN